MTTSSKHRSSLTRRVWDPSRQARVLKLLPHVTLAALAVWVSLGYEGIARAQAEPVVSQREALGLASLGDTGATGIPQQIRAELSQFLIPEQYVLSVVDQVSGADAQGGDVLPGLSAPSEPARMDILLVLDSGVSAAKAELARAIIQRIGGDRVSLRVASAPVLKTTPVAILEEFRYKNGALNQSAPNPPTAGSSPSQAGFGSPASAGQANPNASSPEVSRQPTLFELVQASPRFAVYALAVLWASVASLLGLYHLFKRFVASPEGAQRPSALDRSTLERSNDRPLDQTHVRDRRNSEASNHSRSTHPGRGFDVRVDGSVEGPSDRNTMERLAPERVAAVLSKWLGEPTHGVTMAQQYFSALPLTDLEAVAALMHRDDVAILTQPLVAETSDEHSPELLHRLESRMRAEVSLAVATSGAEHVESPLAFLSQLDKVTLVKILEDEREEDLAAICTQLQPQRLSLLLSHMDEVRLGTVLAAMDKVVDLKRQDLLPLAARLRSKCSALDASLVRPDGQIESAVQMLQSLSDLSKRGKVAAHTCAAGSENFEVIHSRVLLLSDVAHLSKAALRSLAQSLDADRFALCFASDEALGARVADHLPPAYGEVFRENLKGEPLASAQSAAWSDLERFFIELSERGVISHRDIAHAKSQSKDYLLALGLSLGVPVAAEVSPGIVDGAA